MSKAIRSTVHAVLQAAFSYGEGIESLRATYKGQTTEAIRAALLPDVASFPKYAVPLVDGAGKAEGTLVLDKEHAKYEACRKALGRLVSDIVGKSSDNGEEIEIPAEVLAAAAKLAKLAQEYEGARSLAAKALAQAFAK
tara:strand:+ start:52 stop:468 length:417 start_codon:yes stop_codon:yes gene_type:complete